MAKAKHPTKARVDRVAQDMIGRQLRAMYSELLREPLPETLLSTLRAIERAEYTLPQPEMLRRAA
jgi:hypothetical protein